MFHAGDIVFCFPFLLKNSYMRIFFQHFKHSGHRLRLGLVYMNRIFGYCLNHIISGFKFSVFLHSWIRSSAFSCSLLWLVGKSSSWPLVSMTTSRLSSGCWSSSSSSSPPTMRYSDLCCSFYCVCACDRFCNWATASLQTCLWKNLFIFY